MVKLKATFRPAGLELHENFSPAESLKKRKNIDIDFSESTFYDNGKIKTYAIQVNCNDGFKGKTTTKSLLIKNDGKYGFIRNYENGETTEFKIW